MIHLAELHDDAGRRHLRFEAAIKVLPYMRMTRRTRFANTKRGKRAQEYVTFVGSVREAICTLMHLQQLQPLGPGNLGARVRVNIAERRRYRMQDCSNLFKAVEDSCSGALWPDDRRIVELHAEKHLATEDRFVVDAWEVLP